MQVAGVGEELLPYVPRVLRSWPDAAGHLEVEGTLVSADLSGFTALSERLAALGREGAEELTTLLNACFTGMIEIIEQHGGDVLKFGGDALLILFMGDGHADRIGVCRGGDAGERERDGELAEHGGCTCLKRHSLSP